MRAETRQNLIAIAIGLGIVALIFYLCIRPAVVMPVGPTVLERSIGEPEYAGDRYAPRCTEHEGGFTCGIAWSGSPEGSGADWHSYEVDVDSAGCWEAARRTGSGPTGCINLTDYFGY